MADNTNKQPKWKEIRNNLPELTDSETQQIVYDSDTHGNCIPTILGYKIAMNQYPHVVDAPDENMVDPKYAWDKNIWVDLSVEAQGAAIEDLHNKLQTKDNEVSSLTKSLDVLSEQLLNIMYILSSDDTDDSSK
ncbi:MAG: hypothetical protein [Bacteriophage sp.]|nr:MAG: hypothetical protein [Bacteriophage sp.]